MSNVWSVEGTRYMFEIDRREYADGRATGEVLQFEPAGARESYAFHVGNFTISPTGKLSRRAPAALQALHARKG